MSLLSRKRGSGDVSREISATDTAGLALPPHTDYSRKEQSLAATSASSPERLENGKNNGLEESGDIALASSSSSYCWKTVYLAVLFIVCYAAGTVMGPRVYSSSSSSIENTSQQALEHVDHAVAGGISRDEDEVPVALDNRLEHVRHHLVHPSDGPPPPTAAPMLPTTSSRLPEEIPAARVVASPQKKPRLQVAFSSPPPPPANSDASESMPPSIRGLRNVALPATWRLLHEFFSKPDQIKLHVYDLDEAAKTTQKDAANVWDTHCGAQLKLANSSFGDKQLMKEGKGSFGYSREFGSEVLLAESIRRSAFYVSSPEAADYVLISSCIMGRGTAGQYQVDLLKTLESDPGISTRFKEDRRSIVLTLTADHGPCYNRKERRGGTFSRKLKDPPTERWISPGLWGVTMLTHEGSLIGLGCYDRHWASTVPTAAASFRLDALSCDDPSAQATIQVHHNNGHAARSNLVFFSGKTSAGVREQIANVIEKQKLSVYHSKTRFGYWPYICAMRNSVFCFAPRGNAVWSPRLEEALAAGCIPIIAADGYDPPYSRILDYRTFSVRIRKRHIGRTADIVAAISEEKREEMRQNGAAALAVFRYSAGTRTLKPGEDAAPLLAFQLWLRANSRLEELGKSSTWTRDVNYTDAAGLS